MFLHVHLVTIPEHEILRINNNQLAYLPCKKGICKNDSVSFFVKRQDMVLRSMACRIPPSLCVYSVCTLRE